jgi:hypothetical protein
MLLSINFTLPVTVTYFGHFWNFAEKKQNSKLSAYGHGEGRGQTNAVFSIIIFIIHVRTRTHTVSFILCDCVMKSHNLYQRM